VNVIKKLDEWAMNDESSVETNISILLWNLKKGKIFTPNEISFLIFVIKCTQNKRIVLGSTVESNLLFVFSFRATSLLDKEKLKTIHGVQNQFFFSTLHWLRPGSGTR